MTKPTPQQQEFMDNAFLFFRAMENNLARLHRMREQIAMSPADEQRRWQEVVQLLTSLCQQSDPILNSVTDRKLGLLLNPADELDATILQVDENGGFDRPRDF